MDNIKKFKDFLDKMQGLLDNAHKQGHIVIRVDDLERTFPELREEKSDEKPNGGIVLEDFNGGEGFYKLHLDYLNSKQVEEVEELIRVWNKELKTPNENIKDCIGMCLTSVLRLLRRFSCVAEELRAQWRSRRRTRRSCMPTRWWRN